MNAEQLREKRNQVVKKYIDLKEPLQRKRELQFQGKGEGLNETDWEMWDLLDQKMNEELAPIDHELFLLGRV